MIGLNKLMLHGAVRCVGGKNTHNEDNFLLGGRYKPVHLCDSPALIEVPGTADGVFAVTDGMGGMPLGEVAACTAVAALAQQIPALLSAPHEAGAQIAQVSAAVRGESQQRQSPMGTTLAMAIVVDGTAHVYNVGDSRGYVYQDGTLTRLTTDHTLAQGLRDMGLTHQETGLHRRLTQYLGMEENEFTMEAHYSAVALRPHSTLLLCSDGVTGVLTEGDLAAMAEAHPAPQALANALVEAALAQGAEDNLTALVVRAVDGE